MKNNFGADLKIIVVGNSGTGKTSFVNKWTRGTFSEVYKATIVSEFGYKIVSIDNVIYRIQLWDLAGQDKNAYITRIFCKDAHGAVILCEAGDETSLKETSKWQSAINENAKFIDESNIPIMLIENKADLLKDENAGKEEFQNFSDKNNFTKCFRASAKTGMNVNESMEYLINAIVNQLKMLDVDSLKYQKCTNSDNIVLNKNQSEIMEKNKKCC